MTVFPACKDEFNIVNQHFEGIRNECQVSSTLREEVEAEEEEKEAGEKEEEERGEENEVYDDEEQVEAEKDDNNHEEEMEEKDDNIEKEHNVNGYGDDTSLMNSHSYSTSLGREEFLPSMDGHRVTLILPQSCKASKGKGNHANYRKKGIAQVSNDGHWEVNCLSNSHPDLTNSRNRYEVPTTRDLLSTAKCSHQKIVKTGASVNNSSTAMIISSRQTDSGDRQRAVRHTKKTVLGNAFFEKEHCPQAVLDYANCELSNSDSKQLGQTAKMHLSFEGWKFWYVKTNTGRELRYQSPKGKTFNSLRTACKAWVEDQGGSENITTVRLTEKVLVSKKSDNDHSAIVCSGLDRSFCSHSSQLREAESGKLQPKEVQKWLKDLYGNRKKVKKSHSPIGQDSRSGASHLMQSPRLGKRNLLSWLIDKGIVSPMQKVFYISRKNGHAMAEGEITREGIRCRCCRVVHTLTGFEIHAGSTNHRPAAHIFLQDGRSLSQCQKQILLSKHKGFKPDVHEQIQSDETWANDSECSICHDGGNLLLCDQCPSAFHQSCIGLKDIPQGTWFCPFCCCGICYEGGFDTKLVSEKTPLYCDQCQREYHMGCMRKSGLRKLETCLGNWFCSETCSKIFCNLQKLLGKSKPTHVEGLSWTILRSEQGNTGLHGSNNLVTNKLMNACALLQECFPAVEKTLIENAISNKWSQLPRLSFRGFYTIILERGDMPISAAIVRIYDKKAAEMPLIGTCDQYRQQGMCHLLVNEIEKMLSDIGVERLFLPSIPTLLATWISSFGFTKMSSSHRLNFLEYVFWSFLDTTMCQKLLTSTTESSGNADKMHLIQIDRFAK